MTNTTETITYRGEEWEVCPLEPWQYERKDGDKLIVIRRKPKPPLEAWVVIKDGTFRGAFSLAEDANFSAFNHGGTAIHMREVRDE